MNKSVNKSANYVDDDPGQMMTVKVSCENLFLGNFSGNQIFTGKSPLFREELDEKAQVCFHSSC